ncbi:MAG: DUF6064 family protein [Acidobacteriota bacterium]|nr:DUF6064 family protein [Acidobacteriota bacterium]
MPEWWTYTLEDLQSFSLETYYRLFERYNAAIWPGQIVALALGVAILAVLRRGASGRRGRLVAGILAACWVWTAIAFHATRYATIHRGAPWFAWAYGLEALLLVGVGFLRGGLSLERRGGARWIGLALFLFALFVQPLAGMLFGRDWRQVETFGVAPDPTAVGTLGLLLLTAGRVRWALIAVPLLWCAFSGATLLAMGTPAGWVMVAAAVLAVLGSGLNL